MAVTEPVWGIGFSFSFCFAFFGEPYLFRKCLCITTLYIVIIRESEETNEKKNRTSRSMQKTNKWSIGTVLPENEGGRYRRRNSRITCIKKHLQDSMQFSICKVVTSFQRC